MMKELKRTIITMAANAEEGRLLSLKNWCNL